ncbi:MAG: DUF4186 domain-containing protein [Victivallales bacterium]|nr:DUF4186 domain-containing protein [bacterium]MDD7750914.1 DUF4186 domain-containing protein [bacterium]MDY5697472.1 DUF4186 domain-containing protein [Victivallales bacterium]
MTEDEWRILKARLAQSKFRSRFRLSPRDLQYLAERGFDTVAAQCATFVRTRLAPAEPPNDGRQTPMRGHPCFPAQHATGCCCRGCLFKWHGIPPGRPLSEQEIDRIAEILMFWIRDHSAGVSSLPRTPDLFGGQ